MIDDITVLRNMEKEILNASETKALDILISKIIKPYGSMFPPTSNVGIVVDLCEQFLPGWCWGISQNRVALLYRRAENQEGYDLKVSSSEGLTPAHSLCIAIIRALIAQSE